MKEPPQRNTGRELVETSIEAALNLVPVAGGSVAVAFGYLMKASYEQRMSSWLKELAVAVGDLQDREFFTVEELANDDRFLNAVAVATRASERTHRHEKLAALRNAVLNSTLPGAPDADLQMLFLRLIDDFTATHLLILTLLNDPIQWYKERGIPRRTDGITGTRYDVLEEGISGLTNSREACDAFARELTSNGLLTIPTLAGNLTIEGMYGPATSQLGKDFIAFITEPPRNLA